MPVAIKGFKRTSESESITNNSKVNLDNQSINNSLADFGGSLKTASHVLQTKLNNLDDNAYVASSAAELTMFANELSNETVKRGGSIAEQTAFYNDNLNGKVDEITGGKAPSYEALHSFYNTSKGLFTQHSSRFKARVLTNARDALLKQQNDRIDHIGILTSSGGLNWQQTLDDLGKFNKESDKNVDNLIYTKGDGEEKKDAYASKSINGALTYYFNKGLEKSMKFILKSPIYKKSLSANDKLKWNSKLDSLEKVGSDSYLIGSVSRNISDTISFKRGTTINSLPTQFNKLAGLSKKNPQNQGLADTVATFKIANDYYKTLKGGTTPDIEESISSIEKLPEHLRARAKRVFYNFYTKVNKEKAGDPHSFYGSKAIADLADPSNPRNGLSYENAQLIASELAISPEKIKTLSGSQIDSIIAFGLINSSDVASSKKGEKVYLGTLTTKIITESLGKNKPDNVKANIKKNFHTLVYEIYNKVDSKAGADPYTGTKALWNSYLQIASALVQSDPRLEHSLGKDDYFISGKLKEKISAELQKKYFFIQSEEPKSVFSIFSSDKSNFLVIPNFLSSEDVSPFIYNSRRAVIQRFFSNFKKNNYVKGYKPKDRKMGIDRFGKIIFTGLDKNGIRSKLDITFNLNGKDALYKNDLRAQDFYEFILENLERK